MTPSSQFLSLIPFLLLAPLSDASTRPKQLEKTSPSYTIGVTLGHTWLVLGSEESRAIDGLTFGYGKPEPRYQFRGVPAQMVWEIDLEQSSPTAYLQDVPTGDRTGVAVQHFARWRGRTNRRVGLYVDIGWGCYVAEPTDDLNTWVNSSPLVGVGLAFGARGQEWLLGLRYRHSSNGGAQGPNHGQNAVLLTLQYRF